MNLIELVPRNQKETEDLAKTILQTFKDIHGINIPDIVRLNNPSHQVVEPLLKENITAIPHIRIIGRPIEETLKLIKSLIPKGLKSVLLVKGDPPQSFKVKTYPISTLKAIETIKKNFPSLNVYAALDPYRQSFAKELRYCQEKLNAGADGFFTQPFFDIAMANIFINQIKSTLFMGISPVITQISQNYWINHNQAIFPKNFQLNMKYNCDLAQKIIALSQKHNQNCYLMPIKVDPITYLKEIFN